MNDHQIGFWRAFWHWFWGSRVQCPAQYGDANEGITYCVLHRWHLGKHMNYYGTWHAAIRDLKEGE